MSSIAALRPETEPQVWPPLRTNVAPGVSPGRGRALFATAAIAAGEILDRVCTVPLTSEQCDALEEILPLGDYYFRHPANPDEGLMLFGLTSLANHSNDPNAFVRFVASEDLGWIVELVAAQPIAAGAEITHRYRCPPWFEVA